MDNPRLHPPSALDGGLGRLYQCNGDHVCRPEGVAIGSKKHISTDRARCYLRYSHIHRTIKLTGDLAQEQRERLLQIANRCPILRTLSANLRIETDVL